MTAELARSPLAHRLEDLAGIGAATGGEVVVEHVPFLAQVDLRLAPELATRAPYPLPLTPNTAWENGARAALWLGPDEWLILGPPGSQAEIVQELESSLGGSHRSVLDVSDNRVSLELAGSGVKELLAKGCALDLDPRSWRVGSCAQTLLARAQVILHERAETTGILVRPSFADYLVDWLLDAPSGETSNLHQAGSTWMTCLGENPLLFPGGIVVCHIEKSLATEPELCMRIGRTPKRILA